MKKAQFIFSLGVVLVCMAGIWLFVDWFISPREFLFPTMGAVFNAFLKPTNEFFFHIAMTAVAAAGGLSIAIFISSVAVAVSILFPWLRSGIYSIGLLLKATPIVAMVPMLIIWLGTGMASKIAAATLPCFFPILVASFDSIQRTPSQWIDVAKVHGASKWEIFAKIQFPASIPWILSGMRVAAPLSIVGAIVGELVGARAGLGYVIIRASYQLQTDIVFAAILSSAALAAIFVAIIFLIELALAKYEL